ncbi:hypothetical protein [Luteolibacter marinus]|uniref:hypothetical protein n=1 Tax=Luteolibacter marinus TaxID=2776705 RepID=UPI00186660C9|nr:hypothetical protein [Luteolibacter marinus]
MRTLLLLFALFMSVLPSPAADGKFINVALLTLPPKYLADIPLENRTKLLLQLSSSPGEDRRLDYAGGWLHYYSDGPPADSPGATSMFWIKLLSRGESRTPLVFVHMAKPFAAGGEPAVDQTFVLAPAGRGEWEDVTASVMPAGIDLTMHFRPHASDEVIEAAAYERFERRDGRGFAYRFGKRELDLVWENGGFRAGAPLGKELSRDPG